MDSFINLFLMSWDHTVYKKQVIEQDEAIEVHFVDTTEKMG